VNANIKVTPPREAAFEMWIGPRPEGPPAAVSSYEAARAAFFRGWVAHLEYTISRQDNGGPL
jgi:hypothetical protein